MERLLEREIMDGEEQVRAYAQADFSKENQWFVDYFLEVFPDFREGLVLDLGCGPADIPIRLVRANPTAANVWRNDPDDGGSPGWSADTGIGVAISHTAKARPTQPHTPTNVRRTNDRGASMS